MIFEFYDFSPMLGKLVVSIDSVHPGISLVGGIRIEYP